MAPCRVTGQVAMCRTFAASSARLRVPLLGYERNSGADAVQENPTKPAKMQQIGAFELGGFGCCWAALSHRKGIGHTQGGGEDSNLQPVDFSRCVAVLCFLAFSCVVCVGMTRCLGGFVLRLFSGLYSAAAGAHLSGFGVIRPKRWLA